MDNYRAAREATEYLIRLGHTAIGTISAANNSISTLLRMQGFRDALSQASLELPEGYIRYTSFDYSYSASLSAARSILSLPDRPTALFCIGDSIALAAVVAAQELGLKVPQDVSIVGFDDVIYTKMFHPYLTTVVQPCAELGAQSVEMLHQLITQGKLRKADVILPHGFIIRESTGAPAQICI